MGGSPVWVKKRPRFLGHKRDPRMGVSTGAKTFAVGSTFFLLFGVEFGVLWGG